MTIELYAISGSPFVWKVQLALKKLDYDFKLLSASEGDTKKPAFLALNPRGKAPVLVDNGFVLYESSVIIDYLEDKYPQNPLWPQDLQEKALAKRAVLEIQDYIHPHVSKIMREILMNKNEPSLELVEESKAALAKELSAFNFERPLGAVVFTLYPMLALMQRVERRKPIYKVGEVFTPKAMAFMKKIESLPYFEKTVPPHWKG
jgi:glutathione S-transferase